MPNLETEFTELIEKANALGVAAETHDKECSTTCGESDHYCLENRVFIVALVMDRLGLDITEMMGAGRAGMRRWMMHMMNGRLKLDANLQIERKLYGLQVR